MNRFLIENTFKMYLKEPSKNGGKNNDNNINNDKEKLSKIEYSIPLHVIVRNALMMPVYTEICNDFDELNSKIHKPSISKVGPMIGFYFQQNSNNEYNYNISFHDFMIGSYGDLWKQ